MNCWIIEDMFGKVSKLFHPWLKLVSCDDKLILNDTFDNESWLKLISSWVKDDRVSVLSSAATSLTIAVSLDSTVGSILSVSSSAGSSSAASPTSSLLRASSSSRLSEKLLVALFD